MVAVLDIVTPMDINEFGLVMVCIIVWSMSLMGVVIRVSLFGGQRAWPWLVGACVATGCVVLVAICK